MFWVSLIRTWCCWGELPNWDHLRREEVLFPSDEVWVPDPDGLPGKNQKTIGPCQTSILCGGCRLFIGKLSTFPFFFPRKFSSGASAVRTRADTFSFTINGKTLKAKARWWLWTVAGGGSKRRCLARQHQSAGEGSSSSSSWSSSSSCTIIRTHLNTELWFRKTRHVEEIRKVQKSGWCLCVLMSLNCVNEIAYKSIWQWSDDGHSFDLFIWLVGWTQLLFWLRFLLFSGEHETLLWLLAGLWQSAGVRHRQYFRREKIPAEHGTTCKLHTLLDTGQQTVKKKAMDDVGSYYHVWKKQIVQGRWHLHLLGRKAEWVSKKIIYNSARF